MEKAKLKNDGIMKYFDKSKLSKQAPPTSKEATPPTTAKSNGKTAVDEIIQKASGLNISAGQGQVKGQIQAPPLASSVSAIPDHVISEGTNGDAASVRRSPRLAKRARPLNDEVSRNTIIKFIEANSFYSSLKASNGCTLNTRPIII